MKGLYLTLALILGLAEANAITIRFDDTDRPPSDTLNVGGVTVTGDGWGGPGRPTTAFGVGLGSDVLGSSFAIEQVAHYSAGNFASDVSLSESLRLTVDGVINSITIIPRISVLETGESLDLGFEFLLLNYASGYPLTPDWETAVCDGTSKTFIINSPASHVDLAVSGSFGEDYYFAQYRRSRGLPDETLVFGFAIKSLDYTPVPDTANSAGLLGIGIFGIVCAGRKRGWFAGS